MKVWRWKIKCLDLQLKLLDGGAEVRFFGINYLRRSLGVLSGSLSFSAQQIADKNHEIENLQRSLEDKKVKANLLAKQHQSILETSDLTIQKIQQNVNEVSVQLKKLIRENRQAEKTLHEVRQEK